MVVVNMFKAHGIYLLLGVWLFTQTAAKSICTITDLTSRNFTKTSYTCSTFQYYGPQPDSAGSLFDTITTRPILLDGDELCNPEREVVQDSVVVVGEGWPLSCSQCVPIAHPR